MIKTYKEEIYSRRNKNAIFWFVVFIFSGLLYLFFQWYYIKLDILIDSWKSIKPSLKQFWIVNIRTTINPDNIFINWKNYSIWNKEILDYWNYKVEIYWKDIIPTIFDIIINKDYPIFFETINLFKKLKYTQFNSNFDNIYKVDENYFVFQKNSKLIEVYDSNFVLSKMFLNDYIYIWYKYFSNNWAIYVYDYYSNVLKPFILKDSDVEIFCSNSQIINTKLFCNDTNSFIDWTKIKWNIPILKINENIVLTSSGIYNNTNLWNWGSYEYKNKLIINPLNIVHIDNIPLALEDWQLNYLDSSKNIKFIVSELQVIKNAIDFWDETILIWLKWGKKLFVIINWKRRYGWDLWNIDFLKLKIYKIKWVYVFNTWDNLYLYYKWARDILSILSWENIKIIDNMAFFKKWDKSYYLDFTKED